MVLVKHLPYKITLYRDDWDIIEQWCFETIGDFDVTWYKLGVDPAAYVVDGDISTQWFFKDEKDAIMFKLRWA